MVWVNTYKIKQKHQKCKVILSKLEELHSKKATIIGVSACMSRELEKPACMNGCHKYLPCMWTCNSRMCMDDTLLLTFEASPVLNLGSTGRVSPASSGDAAGNGPASGVYIEVGTKICSK